MTRLIYEDIPILFETNGDCSAITLNFPDECIDLVRVLRGKLRASGFSVRSVGVNDNQLTLTAKSAGDSWS